MRTVFDAKDQYPSQWLAIESIAARSAARPKRCASGCTKGAHDSSARPGPTRSEQQCIKELEREVRKINEILKLASTCFAQAELDRHNKK